MVPTKELVSLVGYVQKLGTNRGAWREVFEPQNVALSVMGIPPSADLVARGEEEYAEHCIGCHGAKGDGNGLAATFLFTMEPVILGYSALATHDGPAVAGLAVALLAFVRWLRVPDLKHAVIFGAAFGFSINCKFSSIVFVPVTCIAILAVRLLRDAELRRRFARALGTMIPAALVTLFVIWAGYAFTVHTVAELQPWIDSYPPRLQHLLAHISPATPLPAPAFFVGLSGIHKIDKEGMDSFLCGHAARSGWWWYFPFAIVLKTTIAALLLFIAGFWFALRDRELRGVFAEWSLAALAIIAVAMPSTLDLGVRYILPFYVPFAIACATTVVALLRKWRVVAITLLLCHLGASVLTHPDYFPYFNAFAGKFHGQERDIGKPLDIQSGKLYRQT